MACGNNMVSRSGLQSAPVSIAMPAGPGPARPQPSTQQVTAVLQQTRAAMDQAERRATSAATPTAAADAVRDAQRALDAARRSRDVTKEQRSALVRELERKLEHVKRTASAAADASMQAQSTADRIRRENEFAGRIQTTDRLSKALLGVPARATSQASEPAGTLRKRIDQVGGAEAISHHAGRSRMKEDTSPSWGHAYKKHVDVSDAILEQRLANGLEHATRWMSDEAIVITNATIWANPASQRRREEIETRLAAGDQVKAEFAVHASLAQIFGDNWRARVDGLSRSPSGAQKTQWGTDGQAIAFYKQQDDGVWYLHTCYPSPDVPS